jgi:SAM-dependent methyltransferase
LLLEAAIFPYHTRVATSRRVSAFIFIAECVTVALFSALGCPLIIQFADREHALAAWYQTPLGRALADVESAEIQALLPQLFGCQMIQMGALRVDEVFRTRGVLHTTVVNSGGLISAEQGGVVCAQWESLPLCMEIAEAVLALHTMDLAQDPYEALREIDRVLAPGGHVVLVGFNPYSLWGLVRALFWRRRDAPWSGHFFAASRVKDWLRLLNYHCVSMRSVFLRPPVRGERMLERLACCERWSQRLNWRWFGASYVILARKRPLAARPVKPRWRPRRALVSTSAVGTTQRGLSD